jgi:hypothetical protein
MNHSLPVLSNNTRHRSNNDGDRRFRRAVVTDAILGHSGRPVVPSCGGEEIPMDLSEIPSIGPTNKWDKKWSLPIR